MTTPQEAQKTSRTLFEMAPGEASLLLVALLFPTLGAWVYFVALAGHPAALAAYVSAKLIQFALPLAVFLPAWRAGGGPATAPLLSRGRIWLWGLGSGALLCAVPTPLYFALLRGSELAGEAARRIDEKLVDFGAQDLPSYLALALVLSLVHSFLEEYYFRWFLFGRLRRLLGVNPALVISSLGFAAHHVIVVWAYTGPAYWPLTVLLSLGIAVSGAFWAWLYHRTGTLLVPWLSHVVADLVIMAIGWDLVSA